MLCRKFKQILFTNSYKPNKQNTPIISRKYSSRWVEIFSGSNNKLYTMSIIKLRVLIRDLMLTRLLSAWSRSKVANIVVKRCRSDRGVRDVLQRFKHAVCRPKRTLLFATVSAAYKNNEEKSGPPGPCATNISDAEMQALVEDIEGMEELAKATLFCVGCAKRVKIDGSNPGVRYCQCEDAHPPVKSYDGWEPYMEAQDVIIWRKEYKPGGLYAYKIYGRYSHLKAHDFALIQMDGEYRKVWDTAVASLSVVEAMANGLNDQDVLHWEVLWPRLFSNRDYVYLRRFKEYTMKEPCMAHKEAIFEDESCGPVTGPTSFGAEKSSIQKMAVNKGGIENKVYVIVSRSCKHPEVPEGGSTIRVSEYWSHMVVKTLHGSEKEGMEFVLTYYDEPAVGGLPNAVMSWAMGRAGPAFLEQMRKAAAEYNEWKKKNNIKNTSSNVSTKLSYDASEAPVSEDNIESENVERVLETDEKIIKVTEDTTEDTTKDTTEETTDYETANNVPEDVTKENDTKEVVIYMITQKVKDLAENPPLEVSEQNTISEVIEKDSLTDSDKCKPIPDSYAVQLEIVKDQVEQTKQQKVTDIEETPESERDSATGGCECEKDRDPFSWWRYLYPSYYYAWFNH